MTNGITNNENKEIVTRSILDLQMISSRIRNVVYGYFI